MNLYFLAHYRRMMEKEPLHYKAIGKLVVYPTAFMMMMTLKTANKIFEIINKERKKKSSKC